MANYPVFKAAKAEAQGTPIVFGVEGDPEPFTIPVPVPAIPLLDLAVEAIDQQRVGGAGESERAALAAFHRFLQAVLGDQWPRFRDAATRARWGVPQVLDVVRHVVEGATGRPTTPPWDAPSTSPETGQQSTEGLYSTAAATPPT
jgi:hypothetical protein